MADFESVSKDENLDLITLAQSGDKDALEKLITQKHGTCKKYRSTLYGARHGI